MIGLAGVVGVDVCVLAGLPVCPPLPGCVIPEPAVDIGLEMGL
jgi:hypothetical protein